MIQQEFAERMIKILEADDSVIGLAAVVHGYQMKLMSFLTSTRCLLLKRI